jgi:predicted DNA-binding transcriptional regulator AlpA
MTLNNMTLSTWRFGLPLSQREPLQTPKWVSMSVKFRNQGAITMKPFQLNVTLDAETIASFAEIIQQAVEHGISRVIRGSDVSTTNDAGSARRKAASMHALFGGNKPPEDIGLLLDTREVSRLLKVSPRRVFAMQVSGEMPAPIRLGRAVRWSYEELRAWIAEGGPPRDKWIWPKPPA